MLSKYKVYPKYKSSKDPFLKDIPDDWLATPIRYLGKLKGGAGFPHSEQGLKTAELSFYKVNALGKADDKGVLGDSEDTISISTSRKLGAYIFQKNSIVFAKVGAALLLARIRKTDRKSCLDNNMMGLEAYSKKVVSDFLFYAMQLIKFDYIVNPGAVPSLNEKQISEVKLAIPSMSEQKKIVHFLKNETAKIDILIAKQEKLIELLKEKRQAVISHAVTRGLNPDAQMKDSDIEWLGEVPEHWELKKFKYLFKIRKRIAGELGHEILSITQKGIKIKDTTSGDGQLSMDYSKYQLVYKGDFAMNHMDLLTGFVDISKHDGVTSPDYRVFTLEHSQSSNEYYLNILQMGYLDRLFYPLGQGAAHIGRWRLPTEAFHEFMAPCPPQKEQKEIAAFISNTFNKVDKLLNKATNVVSLMKERKVALISAAVTGKIDVRDYEVKNNG